MPYRIPAKKQRRRSLWSTVGVMLFLAFMIHDAAMASEGHALGAQEGNAAHHRDDGDGQPPQHYDVVDEARGPVSHALCGIVSATIKCSAVRPVAPASDSQIRHAPAVASQTNGPSFSAPTDQRWGPVDWCGRSPNDCRAFLQVFLM